MSGVFLLLEFVVCLNVVMQKSKLKILVADNFLENY